MISMLPIELVSLVGMHASDPSAQIAQLNAMLTESVSVTTCDLTAKASEKRTVKAQE